MTSLEGGCKCGQIRFRISGSPKFGYACHCTDCQQLSGSAFSLGLAVSEGDFAVTKGEPREWVKTGSSGKASHQYSCPVCATWTHTRPEAEAGTVAVRPTTLDDHSWFRPVAQIYTKSALPWTSLATLFSYDEMFDDPAPLADAYKLAGIVPTESGVLKSLLGMGR